MRGWAALFAWLIPVSASAAITVTSPVTLTADICDACTPHVFLPLTIAGADAPAVGVRVIDVSLGNLHDRELIAAIAPTIEVTNGFPALSMTIAKGRLRAIGSYRVLLQFAADGSEPVLLTVQLVRSAAAVQTPGTLVIERVHGNPWAPVETQFKPALVLLETTARTGLSALRVVPPIPASASSASINIPPMTVPCPDSAPKAADLQVPAGDRRCLNYTLGGRFPWGALSQTYSLAADELAAPVPVVFEVRSRLARGYILVYALLGLLCSLILKVVLQGRLDLREARVAALDVLDNVRTDLDRHPDKAFQDAIRGKFDALDRAIRGTDRTVIATTRTELEAEWRTAVDKLTTRRQAAQSKFDGLRSVVQTPWLIPAGMVQVIEAVKQPVAKVRELLAADNVGEADAEAALITSTLVTGIDDRLIEWQDTLPGLLNQLAQAPAGVSPDVKTATLTAVTEARSSIGTTRLGRTATIETLLQALGGISQERRVARRSMLAMGTAMDQEVDQVVHVFQRTRADVPELSQAILAARTALFDAVDRPAAGPSAAVTALDAVHAAWDTALAKLSGGPLAGDVKQLYDQRRYVEAATAVRIAIAARVASDANRRPAPVTQPARALIVSDEAGSAAMTFTTASPPLRGLPSIRAFRARTRGEIALAKLWQTALVSVLAGLIGFGIFAPKFIGDYQDFLVIFFWAFGLDLTVDAVTKLAPTRR